MDMVKIGGDEETNIITIDRNFYTVRIFIYLVKPLKRGFYL